MSTLLPVIVTTSFSFSSIAILLGGAVPLAPFVMAYSIMAGGGTVIALMPTAASDVLACSKARRCLSLMSTLADAVLNAGPDVAAISSTVAPYRTASLLTAVALALGTDQISVLLIGRTCTFACPARRLMAS